MESSEKRIGFRKLTQVQGMHPNPIPLHELPQFYITS